MTERHEEQLIQTVVGRMIDCSFKIKKLSLILVLFSVYFKVSLLASLFVIFFMFLDTYYLYWDRKVRNYSGILPALRKKSRMWISCFFSPSIFLYYITIIGFLIANNIS